MEISVPSVSMIVHSTHITWYCALLVYLSFWLLVISSFYYFNTIEVGS
jgi:hypothetical protein